MNLDEFKSRFREKISITTAISNLQGNVLGVTVRKRIGTEESMVNKEFNGVEDVLVDHLDYGLSMEKVAFVLTIVDVRKEESIANFILTLHELFINPDFRISKKLKNDCVLTVTCKFDENSYPYIKLAIKCFE